MEIVIKCFSEAQEAHKGDESPNAPAHISFTCICIVFPLFLQVENARFCNVSVCPIKTQTPSKEQFHTHPIDMGLQLGHAHHVVQCSADGELVNINISQFEKGL